MSGGKALYPRGTYQKRPMPQEDLRTRKKYSNKSKKERDKNVEWALEKKRGTMCLLKKNVGGGGGK